MAGAASGSGRSLLRERDFSLFLTARLFSNIAAQMQTVAVGWQVYAVTRNPLDLGLIGLSQFLPFIVLILPAGHVADTFDRRRIVTLCYSVQVVCALGLWWLTARGLQSSSPVFAIMALLGVARAFAMPTGQALIPNLVPKEKFSVAVALNSSVFQATTIVGPTLGGLLFLAGAQVTYASVAMLVFAALLLSLGLRSGGRSAARAGSTNWRDLLAGLSFVRQRPIVFGAISLDLFAVLFGGATALLPIYARDILHAGPSVLGLLRTAPGIGAMLCGLWLAIAPISRHVGRWMFGGVALFGVGTLVFGASTNLIVSLIALTLIGAGDMVSVYIRHLLVQLETPDAIRGRVSAVNAVFIGASNELGEFESGITAGWFGTVRAVLVGGAATIAVAALWARWFPSLWRMDQLPRPVHEREAAELVRT